ncbi:hypothetical protein DFJ43DRAFT_1042875 [Lentinula guzmanii]|uniref:Alpha-type protein kinase domain-containing protein n=1 Tax=Lentinula guzmanii TaxID=2804957 RepID=A0AA38JAW1_9AGAR|nr:hypothetical protein DFJ43DRAFT_1044456 [Lentinula guzmanii]KAJ3718649.1 hypothetical protein DFJ43DRAFT_1042875 [Lentinula guzmanii]
MSQKLTEEVVTAYICAIDYVVSKSVGKWLPVENPNIMDEDELEQPSEPSTDSPEHGLVLECENNNQAIHAVIFYRYAKDILHEFEKRTASLDMKTAAIELSLTFICDNQIIERDPSLWAEFLCISSQDNQGLKDLERTVVFKILLASPYIHLRTSHMCIQVAGLFFTTSSMLEKVKVVQHWFFALTRIEISGGDGNGGLPGLKKFTETHLCTAICKKLGFNDF